LVHTKDRSSMRKLLIILPILLACAASTKVKAQNIPATRHRVMFYNVENLFDPFDDSLTLDEEFTPFGDRHWTWKKMEQKLNGIYKVILAVGEYDPPVLVGLCEVENGFVLHQLVSQTPLSKFEYRVVHRESPDRRGIDVALLYRPDRFTLQEKEFVTVRFPDEPWRTTREILYVRGLLGGDTLHVFVNHWPSKYGGELESEGGRYAAAYALKNKVDSIKIFYPDARILIMGDMNDEPESDPVARGFGACLTAETACPYDFVNLSAILKQRGQYSYKYQGVWGIIDQLIASRSMLDSRHVLYTFTGNAGVFSAPFLLEDDERYAGKRPFRTFIGFKYHGGYSDHLPVYLDLFSNK
ncbi:MAG TPA: endonuclease, partial [Tenuifilaceae bacterium]|nr:endonuclease [Tenuifilaceae bacterium]